MKQLLFLMTGLFAATFYLQSQTITLEDCQQKAANHYPAIAGYQVIEQTEKFNLQNASMAYLPQFSLTAQAGWQSDVTKIDIEVPGIDIPFPDKDQYKAALEMSQLIWDGGKTKAGRENIKAVAAAEKQRLQTEVYALRERVNNIYFGILLLDEQLQLHTSLEKELQRNHDNVESYIRNGVANEADLSSVKVELLKAGQQRIELESARTAYLKMLSVLIGENLHEETVLQKPVVTDVLPSHAVRRPELSLFDAQQHVIESQKSRLTAMNMPVVALFAQGGYGKPGLNMLDNQFSPYFIGGVKLSWNFGNLYTWSNEKKKINLQQQELQTQRETFLYNLDIILPQQQSEIDKYRRTMQDDDEIIALRKIIREAAEAKVENGTLTVSDLMKEIHAEEAAKQTKVLHEIQLLMAVYHLKFTTNQ